MDTYKVFETYNGFGYYDSDLLATLELALPALVLPNQYEYVYMNISNANLNGLVVNMKRKIDDGTGLGAANLNYETIEIDLNDVPIFEDIDEEITAEPFDENKPIIVFIYHDKVTAAYHDNNLKLYQELDGGVPFAPAKNGFGVLKKM